MGSRHKSRSKSRSAEALPALPAGGTSGIVMALAATLFIVGMLPYLFAGLEGQFVFDSTAQIANNQRIHDGSLTEILRDSRRPVMEMTLALNSNMADLKFETYRFFNILIHGLAGLTLFGVIRRTLMQERMSDQLKRSAHIIAFVAALIWTVHPLQTQAVAYTIQRAESMMGLFYLLMLYCTLRGASSEARGMFWYIGAVVASVLGMGSKAVMVTAPITLLLFDRCLISGSFKAALKERWSLYVGVAATWGVLLALGIVQSLGAPAEGSETFETVGFGVETFTATSYALTQSQVVLHYIRLSFLPWPLALDYDWQAVTSVSDVIPQLAVIALMLTGTLYLLWKKPALGFVCAWFFLILAPTSSVIPITDAAFEHRMYLSLASVVILVVLGIQHLSARLAASGSMPTQRIRSAETIAALLITGTLMVMTYNRTNTYDNRTRIWSDTVEKRPDNARARRGLAGALLEAGKAEEALPHVVRMSELEPEEWFYQYLLAGQLIRHERFDEAFELYRAAAAHADGDIRPLVDLGSHLSDKRVRRYDESFAAFEEAIEIGDAEKNPGRMYKAHFNYGIALYRKAVTSSNAQRPALLNSAIEHYDIAADIRSNQPGIQSRISYSKGLAYEMLGQIDQAIASYEAALESNPANFDATRQLNALRSNR